MTDAPLLIRPPERIEVEWTEAMAGPRLTITVELFDSFQLAQVLAWLYELSDRC